MLGLKTPTQQPGEFTVNVMKLAIDSQSVILTFSRPPVPATPGGPSLYGQAKAEITSSFLETSEFQEVVRLSGNLSSAKKDLDAARLELEDIGSDYGISIANGVTGNALEELDVTRESAARRVARLEERVKVNETTLRSAKREALTCQGRLTQDTLTEKMEEARQQAAAAVEAINQAAAEHVAALHASWALRQIASSIKPISESELDLLLARQAKAAAAPAELQPTG